MYIMVKKSWSVDVKTTRLFEHSCILTSHVHKQINLKSLLETISVPCFQEHFCTDIFCIKN
jgi:hypothetical protein